MSPPRYGRYAIAWLLIALVAGGACYGLTGRAWLSLPAGAVCGLLGIALLAALTGSPAEPGDRAPDDPRR